MWPRFAADERLVSLVRRGDLTAFEVLYDRHARELLSFCSCILGSRHDAEDAVQSTFASAYRALMADQRRVDLRPWLFSIARNASLSILRKRQPTTEMHETTVAGDDPVAQAEQRESLRQVVATMRDLPERQRTALVLAELHGLSHGEIGTVLGVPAKSVKSYIYQARSSLISERIARGVDCTEIRQELATARGAALLKGRLRRHLRSCEGCRDYAAAISRQRGQLGILVPLAPTMALKRRVLDAASSNATGAGTYIGGATTIGASVAGTAELAGTGVKALVAKVLIGVAGVGAGTGAGTLALSVAATGSPRPVTHVRLAAAVAGGRRAATGAANAESPPAVIAPVGSGQNLQGSSGDRRSRSARGGAAAGTGHGKGADAQASGAGHGNGAEGPGRAAEAHGGAGAHGKSAEAHARSAESHGNGETHGKSAEAHGKSGEEHGKSAGHGKGSGAPGNAAPHGKSGEAHGNAAGHANSGEAHGNGMSAKASNPAAHANGEGAASQGGAPGNGNAGANLNGNAGGNGANASGSPAAGHAEASPPAVTGGPSSGNGAGSSHGQGEPSAPAGNPHEAPSGHPQKP